MNPLSPALVALLQGLVLEGWQFWLEEDRLRYRAPKLAVTGAVLEQLKPEKAAIIRILAEAPHLLELCPLSYGQQALWFLWKLAPDSHAYNQSLPLRIGGDGGDQEDQERGDAVRWRHACWALVARHPMLRTIFPMRGGRPYQQVLPGGDAAGGGGVPSILWTAVDAAGWRADELAAALAAAHAAPFDLANAPPIRFHWFAGAEESGGDTLLITMHHILCDGWSLEIMRRELNTHDAPLPSAAIDARPATRDGSLPVLSFTYHDYVHWQNGLLASAEGDRLWHFWRDQLAGPLPLLTLPADYPRPPIQRYDGASSPLALPATFYRRLQALAQREGATVFELLLAAFLTLLYRLTGQQDLIVGVPNTGRSRAEFAPLVGYFVNPVVLRVTVTDGQTFGGLLHDVCLRARQAIDHAEFPFPLLVQRLQPERSPDRSPIFDVTINYLTRRGAAGSAQNGAPERLQVVEIPQADGKFDLTLTMVEEDGQLRGALGYNRAIFEPVTVTRWSGYLTTLLHSILEDPDGTLDTLPLHPGSQADGAAGAPGPMPALRGAHHPIQPHQMIHLRCAAQARRTPDAPAVADAEVTLTYAELDARAEALAATLRALGAGADARVGVCTGRSVDFCVAMLAALKAGAAYVPLDPAHPPELLGTLMEHAGIVALLTQRTLLAHLPPAACPVICVDEHPATARASAPAEARTAVQLHDLAYVMYTSGSTGRPKAVAIDHAAVANYTDSMIGDLAIDGPYNFLLVSTFGADLGNTVIFPALCTGGCLHILPEAARLDPQRFAETIAARQIDYLKIVPSHLAALLGDAVMADAAVPLALPRRVVVFGGEGVAPAWVARLQAAAPGCRFYNHYGPTETTVGVLTHAVADGARRLTTATLPLSRAVANCDIFVLDGNLQAVPVGAVGELYVGGPCLARGYLGGPGQTEAGFVQIASDVAGVMRTLYRTGDLARQRADGALEILGRRDRQIKLRGYRIELAQIESILRNAPGAGQAVVITDRDGAQVTALLAYVVPAAPPVADAIDPSQFVRRIYRYLADHLPRYMVPSHIALVDRIPLNANGKVDVQALRRVETTTASMPSGVLPRDAIELHLSRIWAEVLERPQVGITDNYFDLGGHSLLAVRLLALVEETFGLWIPLATLLTHPTIETLAQVIRQEGRPTSGRDAPDAVLVALSRGAQGTPIFLLPGAGGSVMYFADLAQRLGARGANHGNHGQDDRAVWGIQALGLDPKEQIPERIEEIAAHYLAAIRRDVQAAGPYYLVGHSFGGLVAFEMARQLVTEQGSAPHSPVALLCVIDNAAPQPEAIPDYAGYDHGDWLVHIATRIGKLNGVDLQLARTELEGKGSEAQNAYLVERLIRHGLLPAEVNTAYFSRFIDIYRTNARAAAFYRPDGPPLPIDLVLIKASEEDAELGEPRGGRDPAWGWARFTSGSVRTVDVAGTHLSIFAEPHVPDLARALDTLIREAGSRI